MPPRWEGAHWLNGAERANHMAALQRSPARLLTEMPRDELQSRFQHQLIGEDQSHLEHRPCHGSFTLMGGQSQSPDGREPLVVLMGYRKFSIVGNAFAAGEESTVVTMVSPPNGRAARFTLPSLWGWWTHWPAITVLHWGRGGWELVSGQASVSLSQARSFPQRLGGTMGQIWQPLAIRLERRPSSVSLAAKGVPAALSITFLLSYEGLSWTHS